MTKTRPVRNPNGLGAWLLAIHGKLDQLMQQSGNGKKRSDGSGSLSTWGPGGHLEFPQQDREETAEKRMNIGRLV